MTFQYFDINYFPFLQMEKAKQYGGVKDYKSLNNQDLNLGSVTY